MGDYLERARLAEPQDEINAGFSRRGPDTASKSIFSKACTGRPQKRVQPMPLGVMLISNRNSEYFVKLRPLRVLFLLFALTPSLLAQTDAPATREDILKLFNLMHVREQVVPVLQAIAKQQRNIIHDNLKRQTPRISPQDLARLDQFTTDIMNDLPVDGMLDDMVPVYQKHFNKSDVDALSAFYSSPIGQKFMHEMPAMTAESMQAAYPRIQAYMDKVMERAQAMARDDPEKKKAPPETNK